MRDTYALPPSSFFFYLQLRHAHNAHSIPLKQALSIHPLYKLIITQRVNSGLVSKLYSFFLTSSYSDLPLDRLWRSDHPSLDADFDWEQVWTNIREASRNPNHQQIHFNYVHRAYLTPRRLYTVKLITDPSCSLCNLNSPGIFIHMMWECPPVEQFWAKVASQLSDLTSVTIPVTVPVLLLNDLSGMGLSRAAGRLVLAGITAAKKLIALRWKPPHSLSCLQALDSHFF